MFKNPPWALWSSPQPAVMLNAPSFQLPPNAGVDSASDDISSQQVTETQTSPVTTTIEDDPGVPSTSRTLDAAHTDSPSATPAQNLSNAQINNDESGDDGEDSDCDTRREPDAGS